MKLCNSVSNIPSLAATSSTHLQNYILGKWNNQWILELFSNIKWESYFKSRNLHFLDCSQNIPGIFLKLSPRLSGMMSRQFKSIFFFGSSAYSINTHKKWGVPFNFHPLKRHLFFNLIFALPGLIITLLNLIPEKFQKTDSPIS